MAAFLTARITESASVDKNVAAGSLRVPHGSTKLNRQAVSA